MATRPPRPKGSVGHRLLNQKTGWQKALVAVGAAAGAIVAIAGLVTLFLPLFRGSPEVAASVTPTPVPAATRDGLSVVRTQTPEADALVRRLLTAAGTAPVMLDLQVLGQPGPADVTLYYACGSAGSCSKTRLQTPSVDGMAVLSDQSGVWFQGCFSVLKKGNGYGADYLDLALTKVGDRCPT
jgi:hypothetical protein